jgi:hypothetical protein
MYQFSGSASEFGCFVASRIRYSVSTDPTIPIRIRTKMSRIPNLHDFTLYTIQYTGRAVANFITNLENCIYYYQVRRCLTVEKL